MTDKGFGGDLTPQNTEFLRAAGALQISTRNPAARRNSVFWGVRSPPKPLSVINSSFGR